MKGGQIITLTFWELSGTEWNEKMLHALAVRMWMCWIWKEPLWLYDPTLFISADQMWTSYCTRRLLIGLLPDSCYVERQDKFWLDLVFRSCQYISSVFVALHSILFSCRLVYVRGKKLKTMTGITGQRNRLVSAGLICVTWDVGLPQPGWRHECTVTSGDDVSGGGQSHQYGGCKVS